MDVPSTQSQVDERLERKLKQAENPGSVVMAFRSRECMAVISTLFSFDKAVSRLRWIAGLQIPMDKATELLDGVKAFTGNFEGIVTEVNGGTFYDLIGSRYEDLTTKRILANKRNATVFFPRTEEGDKVARLLKNLDPNLFLAKSGSLDFARTAGMLKKVYEVMLLKFHEITETLCETTQIEYRPSKALTAYLNGASGKEETVE